ncbi:MULTISPECIES: hypothetical protein [Salimicrobium]|uniref:Uncharacterized protein n=3 Tax=Salimicrobium TaxID=351195 RepID=K2HA36_9BACI|nr:MULTISPECIES: hypothetical protein [Salimicrobium]AKG05143.1 hypothetical protein AAV35_010335 [Salimicrobium jeotgali]EKE32485.1 hypothetical protein MJ3_03592 [Salimicrobium jeotgali]MBM7695533.1 hypothetical protein [Salimicrobium jeotgali]SDY14294.1 hypothetical protein SAMN04488081_2195 [Salimicrobium album]SIS77345.1 hypothetical protein SAMN05421758_105179 [Salimicrobium salexigens]
MYPLYYTAAIIMTAVALGATIYIGKNLNKQEHSADSDEELASLKSDSRDTSSFRRLSIIYVITFVITLALIWIFIL